MQDSPAPAFGGGRVLGPGASASWATFKPTGYRKIEHILFVCGRNRWRSPTAEQVFAGYPGIECASAGLSHDAETPLSPELVEWADTIFVMEKAHKAKLSAQFRAQLGGKRMICLDIQDKFRYMDPALVSLLRTRVTPHLPPAVARV